MPRQSVIQTARPLIGIKIPRTTLLYRAVPGIHGSPNCRAQESVVHSIPPRMPQSIKPATPAFDKKSKSTLLSPALDRFPFQHRFPFQRESKVETRSAPSRSRRLSQEEVRYEDQKKRDEDQAKWDPVLAWILILRIVSSCLCSVARSLGGGVGWAPLR